MGHADKVHREYNRQNTIDRQVVKISQLLEAALGNAIKEDDESDNEGETDEDEDQEEGGSRKRTIKKRMPKTSKSVSYFMFLIKNPCAERKVPS